MRGWVRRVWETDPRNDPNAVVYILLVLFALLFPIFAFMSFVYAWGTLPINVCREDIYSHLMWHLGLWKEYLASIGR